MIKKKKKNHRTIANKLGAGLVNQLTKTLSHLTVPAVNRFGLANGVEVVMAFVDPVVVESAKKAFF